jgi:DNA-binding FrmR family transcriptional regulator
MILGPFWVGGLERELDTGGGYCSWRTSDDLPKLRSRPATSCRGGAISDRGLANRRTLYAHSGLGLAGVLDSTWKQGPPAPGTTLAKESRSLPVPRIRRSRAMMNEELKEQLEARLKRIAGQIAGILHMIESDRYCIDVVMQISAARAGLGKVSKLLLASHLETCVTSAFAKGDLRERRAKIAELLQVFDRSEGT